MATVEVSDALWAEFRALKDQLDVSDSDDFLRWCLRRVVEFEGVVDDRWILAAGAIVTRDGAEVLLVGNEYVAGQSLAWNLPGGAVSPGEDLCQAVARELYEETGLEVLEIGRLAWIIQVCREPGDPNVLGFTFEVTRWRGAITLEHEEEGGPVRCARFVPYAEACECIVPGNAEAFCDWLAEPRSAPRFYFHTLAKTRVVR